VKDRRDGGDGGTDVGPRDGGDPGTEVAGGGGRQPRGTEVSGRRDGGDPKDEGGRGRRSMVRGTEGRRSESERHDAAAAVASSQRGKGLVDFIERIGAGDEFLQLELAVAVETYEPDYVF
jgi:hypothetical protein